MTWICKKSPRIWAVVMGIWAVFLLLMVTPPVGATSIDLQLGQSEMTVDGDNSWLDAAPYIKDGRTMVPLNLITRAFHATVDTFYTDDGLQVRILVGKIKVFLLVGDQGAHFMQPIQDTVTHMDVAPEIVEGRVFVPLCFIAKGFGANVNWDPSTGIINIQKV